MANFVKQKYIMFNVIIAAYKQKEYYIIVSYLLLAQLLDTRRVFYNIVMWCKHLTSMRLVRPKKCHY
jgi:hypothetical protein